jgi:hypothetical protein
VSNLTKWLAMVAILCNQTLMVIKLDKIEQRLEDLISVNKQTSIGQISDKVADIESRWQEFSGLYKEQYLPYIKILKGE